MSRSRKIADIMKLESTEPILFIELSRYKKSELEFMTEDELMRILRMLTQLKEAQNPNA